MPLLCGGTTEAKDATEEVQKICDEVGNFTLQKNRNSEVMCHKTTFTDNSRFSSDEVSCRD